MKSITITVDGKSFEAQIDEATLDNLCKPSNELWFPEDGTKAWFISALRCVAVSTCWSATTESDLHKHKLGHIFKTKEEAVHKLAVIDAEYTVRKRIHELNDGWVPDWDKDKEIRKYYVYLNRGTLDLECSLYSKFKPNWMYLKSDELANQLIAELPVELNLILNQ